MRVERDWGHEMSGRAGPGPAEAVTAALREELQRAQWGVSPSLYSIWMRDGACELRPGAVPPEAWGPGPPEAVLHVLAAAAAGLASSPEYRAPDGFYGMALLVEGRGESGQGTAGGVRAVHAADRAGAAYYAVQRRGSNAVQCNVFRPGSVPVVVGMLPLTLARMVSALAGTAQREPEARG
jgi:hypothetical protein